jgi:hypothetical protein
MLARMDGAGRVLRDRLGRVELIDFVKDDLFFAQSELLSAIPCAESTSLPVVLALRDRILATACCNHC